MRKLCFGSAAALAVASILMMAPGCNEDLTEQQKIQKTAQLIRMSTSSATAIGLVAVPDPVEADQIANEIKEILTNSVIPIIEGDEEGLAAGLEKILTLEAFQSEKLAKAKAILEAAVPILRANLPADLIEKGTGKLKPEVVAYVKAGIYGINEGADAYLGSRSGVNYKKMREILSK